MLLSHTDPRWLEVALSDLDAVLCDHAHCEKKAAAAALSLVASYPARANLVRRLSALAIEELRHFRAVHELVCERGLELTRDPGDPYARALLAHVRSSGADRLVDRLLVAGLIEARSHERLALLANGLEDPGLAGFYGSLARAEAGHAELFVRLAREAAPGPGVGQRLDALASEEAAIVAALPLLPRVH